MCLFNYHFGKIQVTDQPVSRISDFDTYIYPHWSKSVTCAFQNVLTCHCSRAWHRAHAAAARERAEPTGVCFSLTWEMQLSELWQIMPAGLMHESDAVTKAEQLAVGQTRDGWLWSGCSCDPHWTNEEWSFPTELGFGMQSSLGRTWQACFTHINVPLNVSITKRSLFFPGLCATS